MLPPELRKNFRLMRDLDAQSQGITSLCRSTLLSLRCLRVPDVSSQVYRVEHWALVLALIL